MQMIPDGSPTVNIKLDVSFITETLNTYNQRGSNQMHRIAAEAAPQIPKGHYGVFESDNPFCETVVVAVHPIHGNMIEVFVVYPVVYPSGYSRKMVVSKNVRLDKDPTPDCDYD